MPAQPDVATIRAAGGVVWRPTGTGCEVCLVHRPRYDDWSLPKGKLEAGEHPLLAAVREVAEETDVRAAPQVRLPQVRYVTRDGTPKAVDYWSMRAVGSGGFEVHTEVDAVRWLPVEPAVRLVSYAHDVRLLRAFAALPPVTCVLAVVRHARSDGRGAGSGAAGALDAVGVAHAQALTPLLALVRPRRLLSAAVDRCVQTLDPLAVLLGLAVETDTTFDEPGPGRDAAASVSAAADQLSRLAVTGTAAVVCAPGEVVARALARLAGDRPDRFATGLGAGWLLAFSADRLVAVDSLDTDGGSAPGSRVRGSD